jgi:uncharacterized protein
VSDEPFHDGETYVQTRAEVREMAARIGPRMIRDFMPDQHRQFFERLRYAIVGTADDDGVPWASLLVGPPGFVRTPDARTVELDLAPAEGDGIRGRALPGRRIALLGIELSTRRRNRMNGTVVSETDGTLTVHVDQSFGNCPKYIQAREVSARADLPQPSRREEGPRLSQEAQHLVTGADTFFIASATAARGSTDPREGLDVSHRGGTPGFVDVRDGGAELWVPDFSGNMAFNTLGNIARNPQVGLCFVDFAAGSLLQVAGRAEIVWDAPLVAQFPGAERLLRVRVMGGQLLRGVVPLRWSAPEVSPQLAGTGPWLRSEGEHR